MEGPFSGCVVRVPRGRQSAPAPLLKREKASVHRCTSVVKRCPDVLFRGPDVCKASSARRCAWGRLGGNGAEIGFAPPKQALTPRPPRPCEGEGEPDGQRRQACEGEGQPDGQ